MSRDDPRAALARAVAKARRVLVGDRKKKETGDIGKQLEGVFGFDRRTGVPVPMERMVLRPWQRGRAEMLRAWHLHLTSGAAGAGEAERARAAYDQMRYELGYTALHRLAALRMAEERRIVQECVGRGRESDAFRMYLQVEGGVGLGARDEVYAFFLERLYDELSRDLPAVFDRRSAASLIAPSPPAIGEVLEAINAPDIAPLWGVDETLGWIFEDYNDPDERKEMREHDAPRNARELAVRNQFFTPRWVVEFLTDNTLGRLWYELSGGKTALAESCRFLLKQAEVPAQGCRDPREIKTLDPACGSGHFLLYVYELFEAVYWEAWEGRHHRSPGKKPLWEEFPDEQAFRREIPRLILEHNVYGVDIDPRCIQEAGVALWLRAHRSWDKLGVKAKDRPRIAKVNLVCAQALSDAPGMRDKLRETLKPEVLGLLVDKLFLRVAEMGVLFRVETAIADTVASVKKDYLTWKQERAQRNLFGEVVGPRQTTLEDFAKLQEGGGDEELWQDADTLLLRAMDSLVEEAEEKDHYRSRLFAEDVRHGLEFFDLSRIKFDVILMNPPFGEPSESTKTFLDGAYPNAGHEVLAMFYERALEMLSVNGRVGAITSRNWLALRTLGNFRKEVFSKKGTVELAADLGYGVLNAKVETAAAVVRAGGDLDAPATWIRLVKTGRKEQTLLEALATGEGHQAVSVVHGGRFQSLPESVYGYWMSQELTKAYDPSKGTVESIADAVVSTQTSDDFRFLRLSSEIHSEEIGLGRSWARFAKGGENRLFFDDVHLLVRWRNAGEEIDAFPKAFIRNPIYFGHAGVTWPVRNLKFGPRALPRNCAFGHKGPTAFTDPKHRLALLSVLASGPVALLLSIRLGIADDDPKAVSPAFEVGLVRDLPWPSLVDDQNERLATLGIEAVEIVRIGQIEDDDTGETVAAFAIPPVLLPLPDSSRLPSFEAAALARVAVREDRHIHLAAIQAEIDSIVADAYGFSERDRQVMDEELEPPLAALPGTGSIDDAQLRTAYLTKEALDGMTLPGGVDAEMDVRVEHRRKKQVRFRDETALCRIFQAPPAMIAALRRRLGLLRKDDLRRAAADIVSYAVGVAFGRWDVRLWAHPEWIPTFADAFDPMPPCPLGQLVDAEGFPATETRMASEHWLAERTHPTTLPLWPPGVWESSAGDYPIRVAWDGVLIDDMLDDRLPHRPDESFPARVDAVLEHLFGVARSDWEHDIARALEVKSITDWLRAPAGFFDDHLDRYSKSRRRAPIYWPITTPSGGLTFWVYAPRFDAETLPALVNHLRQDADHLRHERDVLGKDPSPDAAKLDRLAVLARELDERETLRREIEAVLAWGYAPHPDDGFAITAAPLHFAFRLPKWRDLLAETWKELQQGDYDWAHLAMGFRRDKVMETCKTDRSMAIAHGLEDLFAPPADQKKPRSRKPAGVAPAGGRGRATAKVTAQMSLRTGEGEEDT